MVLPCTGFLFRYMYICQINFLEIIDNLELEVEGRAEAEKQGTGKSAVLVVEEEEDEVDTKQQKSVVYM